MTGLEIKRIYGTIRKIVPENIDLNDDENYTVNVEENTIYISSNESNNALIYQCKFKTPEK